MNRGSQRNRQCSSNVNYSGFQAKFNSPVDDGVGVGGAAPVDPRVGQRRLAAKVCQADPARLDRLGPLEVVRRPLPQDGEGVRRHRDRLVVPRRRVVDVVGEQPARTLDQRVRRRRAALGLPERAGYRRRLSAGGRTLVDWILARCGGCVGRRLGSEGWRTVLTERLFEQNLRTLD